MFTLYALYSRFPRQKGLIFKPAVVLLDNHYPPFKRQISTYNPENLEQKSLIPIYQQLLMKLLMKLKFSRKFSPSFNGNIKESCGKNILMKLAFLSCPIFHLPWRISREEQETQFFQFLGVLFIDPVLNTFFKSTTSQVAQVFA